MRTFKHFPKERKCPICNKNDDKECVLVAIDGKVEDHNAEAEVFHLDCIELWYFPDKKFLAQRW